MLGACCFEHQLVFYNCMWVTTESWARFWCKTSKCLHTLNKNSNLTFIELVVLFLTFPVARNCHVFLCSKGKWFHTPAMIYCFSIKNSLESPIDRWQDDVMYTFINECGVLLENSCIFLSFIFLSLSLFHQFSCKTYFHLNWYINKGNGRIT